MTHPPQDTQQDPVAQALLRAPSREGAVSVAFSLARPGNPQGPGAPPIGPFLGPPGSPAFPRGWGPGGVLSPGT